MRNCSSVRWRESTLVSHESAPIAQSGEHVGVPGTREWFELPVEVRERLASISHDQPQDRHRSSVDVEGKINTSRTRSCREFAIEGGKG